MYNFNSPTSISKFIPPGAVSALYKRVNKDGGCAALGFTEEDLEGRFIILSV